MKFVSAPFNKCLCLLDASLSGGKGGGFCTQAKRCLPHDNYSEILGNSKIIQVIQFDALLTRVCVLHLEP